MADEQTGDQTARDEREWRRQHAILHGEWDEVACYATPLMPASPSPDNAPPDHAASVGDDYPEGYPIKVKRTNKRYHPPGSSWYSRMPPDVRFATEAATQAGLSSVAAQAIRWRVEPVASLPIWAIDSRQVQ